MAKIAQHINNVRDPATRQALQAIWQALRTDLAANKTKFDTHTHAADGAQASTYNVSKPQSEAETISQGTAVTFDQNLEV